MRCPSCAAEVSAGETICIECGTELVLTSDVHARLRVDTVAKADADDSSGRSEESQRSSDGGGVSCPDCGHAVEPDANGLCPICGCDLSNVDELDAGALMRDPLSLDALRAQRKKSAIEAELAQGGPTRAKGGAPDPRALPLPADRQRRRFLATDDDVETVDDAAHLVVEGGQTVFFDGRMTRRVALNVDQVTIGRRDPTQGHYPDLDLSHFRHIDGHISRRHARLFRVDGRWYVEDLCANDATYLNDKAHVLNGETSELASGDRVIISDSVALTFIGAGEREQR